MIDGKKALFSGMQATGNLTLGNYLGALKNFVTLQNEYETFYCVVDEHSITVRQDPAELRKRARNLLTLYIAAGLDPAKNCIYYQSHVSAPTTSRSSTEMPACLMRSSILLTAFLPGLPLRQSQRAEK